MCTTAIIFQKICPVAARDQLGRRHQPPVCCRFVFVCGVREKGREQVMETVKKREREDRDRDSETERRAPEGKSER